MDTTAELHWSDDQAARIVRETYGAVVPADTGVAQSLYTLEELAPLPPAAAGMALGLGNPIRHAGLRPGETVLDLGSGGGIDTLLASQRVALPGRRSAWT